MYQFQNVSRIYWPVHTNWSFNAILKVGPETRDFWWDQRPKTRCLSLKWDLGPKTRDPKGGTQDRIRGTDHISETRDPKVGVRDPGPGTRDPSHGLKPGPGTKRWDSIPLAYMGLETRDPEPESWIWMNLCALCVCVYFVCFSIPFLTAWLLLIFYHLNKLLFPSCYKKFHHAAAMKSLNFREKSEISDNS